MTFNNDKCGCMHLGHGNNVYDYILQDELNKYVEEEKDLGVIIHKSLKSSYHCAKVVKKANKILGIIKRNFKCRDKMFIVKMYKSLVRPHLDYCSQAWRPYLQGDIDQIEKVQRRALRLINGFDEISYEERLKRTKLTTLECRRLRGDLIEAFKILKEIDCCGESLFEFRDDERRGHSRKFYKFRSRLDTRKYFFSQRVVDVWNQLPEEAVTAPSVNAFKSKVDKFLKHVGGLQTSLSRLPALLSRTHRS